MAVKNYLDYEGLTYFKEKLDAEYASIKAFVFKGTVANIAGLPAIANESIGSIYNVTTGGTTTSDFVEGAGHPLQDGENVVAINISAEGEPVVMKWDILGGVFDIEDRLQFGSTMPVSPEDGQTFLYMGDTTYTYSAVTPVGTENPVEEGWYVEDGQGGYELTSDTTVQSGTTYYTREEQYVTGVIYVYDATNTEWVAQSSGDTMIAITNAQIDTLFD